MTTRRLAAILAADVAGFSALMERDEEGTFARIGKLRREVIEPHLAGHQGRLIKTTGDGFLAEFASPIAALRCAMAIQSKLTNDLDALRLRIGLNLGDVIIEEGGDVYGEGVNVAARLETLADPGGILISGKIHSEVEGKVEAGFEDRGEQQVKNLVRPVHVYAVHVAGSPLATSAAFPGPGKPLSLPDKPSIAVLPFQNMSGDPEQDYFADGMVEDITTALSKIQWLFVIARNSAFTYKGKAIDIKQVGRELGVRYVLEGSVRKADNRVRITGQLIDAATGAHLWADRFDGSANDIFDLQDRITESVVVSISPKLRQSEIERSKRKPTTSLTAYDYYLQGISKIYQYRRSTHVEAKALLDKAIELDPEFAIAYAARAVWYCSWRSVGWSTDRVQEAKAANASARKALELLRDDALILAQAGWTLAFLQGETKEGAELTKRATDADPNYAQAWNWRGWISLILGDHEHALEHFKRALRLNPVDPSAFFVLGGLAYAYFFSGRHEEAAVWAEKCVRENPQYLGGRRINIVCLAFFGKIAEAKAEWESVRQLDPSQRISDINVRNLFRNEDYIEALARGFRLAGMPE